MIRRSTGANRQRRRGLPKQAPTTPSALRPGRCLVISLLAVRSPRWVSLYSFEGFVPRPFAVRGRRLASSLQRVAAGFPGTQQPKSRLTGAGPPSFLSPRRGLGLRLLLRLAERFEPRIKDAFRPREPRISSTADHVQRLDEDLVRDMRKPSWKVAAAHDRLGRAEEFPWTGGVRKHSSSDQARAQRRVP